MRLRALTTALVLVVALGGCGSDSSGSGPDSDPPAASGEPAADGCDAITKAADTAGLLDFGSNIDNADLGHQLAEAYATFKGAEPPEELADDWATLETFFEITSAAFGEVDMDDAASVATAQKALQGRGEEFAALVTEAPKAGQRLADYARDECGAKDVSTVTDPCSLLDDEDLKTVFPGDIPEPEDTVLGATMECAWEIDADDMDVDDFLVRIGIVPKGELDKSHLGKLKATGTVDGLENGRIYSGSVGIMSGSGDGHSLIFTDGDHAVIIAVAKGNDSTEDEDVAAATAFAKKIADRL